jgi:serine protease Do
MGINGRPVDSADDLTRQVGSVHPGETARLEVLRGGRTLQLAIRSGLRPSEAMLASSPDRRYSAPDASAEAARVLGMRLAPNPGGGVTVAGVSSDSDAAEKGLSRGDTILQANGRRTATPADVAAAVAAAKKEGRHQVLLMVAHNGRKLFLPLKVDDGEG